MNNKQLDMVLGYLNEDISIDESEYIYEDIISLAESANKDMQNVFEEYMAKFRRLTDNYKAAAKNKDIKEMNNIYKDINSCLSDCEKELNKIKPSTKDTIAMDAWLLALYGLVAFYVKTVISMKRALTTICGLVVGGSFGKGMLLDIKATIKEIKKNGVNADSLNLYKNSCKGNIEKLRKDWENIHRKSVEKVQKKLKEEK